MSDVIVLILTGAVGAGIIKIFDNVIMWKLNRKANASDELAKHEKEAAIQMAEIKEGLRMLLLKRIQDECVKHIQNGEISLEDRRIIHMMHATYHDKLNGNGDLDSLIELIDELPLSQK